MDQTARLITVTVRQVDAGMLFASSDDEPGFYIAATSSDHLYEAIPLAIENMYRSRSMDVAAFPAGQGSFGKQPWAIVPRHLLAKASSRMVAAGVAPIG